MPAVAGAASRRGSSRTGGGPWRRGRRCRRSTGRPAPPRPTAAALVCAPPGHRGLGAASGSVHLTASTCHRPRPSSQPPQRWAAAIDLIGGHPGGRHAGVQGALQHHPGQLRLGPEPDLLRDPRGPTPRRVVGPALGQVQLPVDHRPPLRAGIGQEDAELAVVDLAGGAGVLALDPHRGRALLEEPGLVHHQDRSSRRPGAQPHRRAGRRGPGRGPSRRWPTTAACHRECARRRARPAASRSSASRCPAARADRPTRAGAARRGRTVPRCGRAGRPAQPPMLGLPRCLPPRRPPAPVPPALMACDCRPIPGQRAGTYPHQSKCGWSTKHPSQSGSPSSSDFDLADTPSGPSLRCVLTLEGPCTSSTCRCDPARNDLGTVRP